MKDKSEQLDIWRDTKVRFFGYSNQVGESFKYLYPRLVFPSYLLSIIYIGCDTFDKTYKQYKKDGNQMKNNSYKICFQTLLWQGLASIVLPNATIFCIVRSVRFVTQNKKIINLIQTEQMLKQIKFVPSLFGLASIPFICGPIDHFTNYFLNMEHK